MMRCGRQVSLGPRTTAAVLFCVVALAAWHFPAQAQRIGSAVQPAPPKEASSADSALKLDYSQTPVALAIELPDASVAVTQSLTDQSDNWPRQVGVHLDVPDEFGSDVAPKLDWQEMDDGSIVSSVSVTSPGASAMRLGIKVGLPEGGELRFFDRQTNQGTGYPVVDAKDLASWSESLGAPASPFVDLDTLGSTKALPDGEKLSGMTAALGDDGQETLWSPIARGDTIGVEISLPSADALPSFSFSIQTISHIDHPIDATLFERKRLGCFTHIDAQCAQGRFPQTQADAVASILFDDEDGTFVCTGTLLNDTLDDTLIPYFLTANHCISTPAAAHTVEAWWFWRRAACGLVEIDERFERTYGGAELLATSASQDSSLLRMRGQIPEGVSYSGWNADPLLHPAVVHGLHHPRGDELKYSAGRTLGQTDVRVRGTGDIVRNAIVVRWRDGATEGGSSGSGLFDGEYLLGALSGGTDDCEEGTDVYGPLRDFFPKVRRWLDPIWTHDLPFVTAASNTGQQGFVRIANKSDRDGTVRIHAVDDTGDYRGPVELSLDAHEVVHFNSQDLESGNRSKGLSAGVGDGSGNWRLELTTRVEIDARAYVRTPDGFLTSIHQVAAEVAPAEVESAEDTTVRYHVPFFNPGANDVRQSRLRLINTGVEPAEIVISGRDDLGRRPPNGDVSLTLASGAAHMLTAQALEEGSDDIAGRFGDGTGKWRLTVSADQPIEVMSLMQSATGHLTNLSR